MNLNGFNANEHDEMRDFTPIPQGKYMAIVESSEEVENKNKTGRFLKLHFQIVDGQYKGRKLFVNLNLKHPSAEAVRIAQIELASICKAVGVPTPNDSSDLHDLPLVVSVKLEKRKDNGEPANRICGYFHKSTWGQKAVSPAITGSPSAPSSGAAVGGATVGAGAGNAEGKAPWAR